MQFELPIFLPGTHLGRNTDWDSGKRPPCCVKRAWLLRLG